MFPSPVNLFYNGILLVLLLPCSNVSAQGFNITNGGSVVVNGSASIVLNNAAFVNSGNFVAGAGTVSFTGAADALGTYIGGSSVTSFYNLRIEKSGGGAKLMKQAAVSNLVFMAGRNLDLNGFDLDLGSTGNLTGEGETSYIFGPLGGYINRSINLTAPNAVNAGNMGLEITSAASPGATVIRRGHQQQVTVGGFSINRHFDFTAADNNNLDAVVKFYYLNAELAGITESELEIWNSQNTGASWTLRNRDTWDVANNFVLKNNVNTVQRVTLASAINNALPVSLLYFTGALENNRAKLTWATTDEVQNDHFEIQRAADGRNFTSIASIAGAGTTSATQYYSYTDKEPFANLMYYRLKQVNRDGSFAYSGIVSVNINVLFNNRLVQVFPNPTTGPVSIQFTSSQARQVTLELSDMKGRVISNRVVDANRGLNHINYSMTLMAQGTYFLRVVGIENKAFKIFKY